MNENLPVGWVEIPIKSVGNVLTGTTPSKIISAYYGGEIPFVKPPDLIDDWIEKTNEVLSLSGASNARMLPPNSVLVSCIGVLGKTAINRIPVAFNQQINAVIPSKIIRPKYLFYYFQTKSFNEQLIEASSATTIAIVNKTRFSELTIPLASPEEQIRIVDVLDGLIERIGSAQEQLNRLSKIEDKLLHSCITNEDNELLPTVKLGGYCQESKERIGDDWLDKRLIGVSKDEGITDLRVGTKASFEKYKVVNPGDFLYNPMRVDIGSIGIYDGEELAITSPDYIVFRVTRTLSPLLLFKFLKSELGLAEINNNTRGGVRSRLYFSNLCNINFPLGDGDSQQEAQKLLLVFTEVNKQKKWIERKLDLMKQGFLTKAFAGELTEQDPNDEPALMLLERIRSERMEEKLKRKENKPHLIDTIRLKPRKKMAEQLRPIKDILTTSQTPVSSYTVWQQSIHKNDIEAFYAELKRLVDEEKSVLDIKEGDQSYLTIAHAD